MLNDVQRLIDLTEQLNAVREVSAKLTEKHDPRAENLVTVLQELSKTFDAIELELKIYLALDFSDQNRLAARKDLIALEGGEIFKQVGEARARSGKLGSIYRDELQPWFAGEQELTDQERTNLDMLFTTLGASDPAQIVPAVEEVSKWLTKKAQVTLLHVDKKEFNEAGSDVRAARLEVLSLRQAMFKASAELRELEIMFTPTGKEPDVFPL